MQNKIEKILWLCGEFDEYWERISERLEEIEVFKLQNGDAQSARVLSPSVPDIYGAVRTALQGQSENDENKVDDALAQAEKVVATAYTFEMLLLCSQFSTFQKAWRDIQISRIVPDYHNDCIFFEELQQFASLERNPSIHEYHAATRNKISAARKIVQSLKLMTHELKLARQDKQAHQDNTKIDRKWQVIATLATGVTIVIAVAQCDPTKGQAKPRPPASAK